MSSASSKAAEVFQVAFTVERQWAGELIKAVLGSILFYRTMGNVREGSQEVCGVTMPVPANLEIEAIINTNVDAFSNSLLSGSRSRMVIALYPTTEVPRPIPIQSKSRSHVPSVMSPFNWLGVGGARTTSEEIGEVQNEAIHGQVWEGWVIDVEVVTEGARGVSEEKLRSQLNDFLLRSVSFVMNHRNHIPPITSQQISPFGIQILVNPALVPFSLPKAEVTQPDFPLLHNLLVGPTRLHGTRQASYAG